MSAQSLAQDAAAEIVSIYALFVDAPALMAPYGAKVVDLALRVDRAIRRAGTAIERLDFDRAFIQWPVGKTEAQARHDLGAEADSRLGRWPRFSAQEHRAFGRRLSEANRRLEILYCHHSNHAGQGADVVRYSASAKLKLLRFRSRMDGFAFADFPDRPTAELASWYLGGGER